jgi:5-methylcytosine-specific restriction endonuclease McrA
MAKKRVSIPRQVADAVLKEYRHKCAVCGRHSPQLHHLDEDPTNNDPKNLLPLCPSCHLQDIHDPTSPPELRKLRLFRIHKDPLILDPRFHPIYRRMGFLYDTDLPISRPALFRV